MPSETPNIWLDVAIQPSYGKSKALVTWKLAPAQESALVYVYRSIDGNAPWELLNEDNPVQFAGSYEDDLFYQDSKLLVMHYRLLALVENKYPANGEEKFLKFPSPTVGLFSKISRREYGAVHKMMASVFLDMRSGNGAQVWIVPPLNSGELAAGVDPDTYQKTTVTCPGDPGDGYGRLYAGGYAAPLITWVAFPGPTAVSSEEMEETGAADEKVIKEVRLLAWPRPQKGYLIVNPRTDDRYVVGAKLQELAFRGLFPIVYTAELSLLDRNDDRYLLEMPAL
jgi:hypothetical protein